METVLPKKPNIAVVGAGFSGIAAAYFLLKRYPEANLTLFDAKGIGAGASGIAAGLLHPFVGAHSKLNVRGREGYHATLQLLKIAEKSLRQKVFEVTGFYRIATDQTQLENFTESSEKYPDIQPAPLPEGLLGKGFILENAITVDTQKYLEGLWKACAEMGAVFERREFSDCDGLSGFDIAVLAIGAYAHTIKETENMPVSRIKGQVVKLEWPNGLPYFDRPINSYNYMIMHPEKQSCTLGATYERVFLSEEPNMEAALRDMMPKARVFFPGIEGFKPISCLSGVRASCPGRMPVIRQLNQRTWVITGMGSRGLLYHALYAEELAQMIAET